MPKYILTVREEMWHTFEIDSDQLNEDLVESKFYEMSEAEQLKFKTSTESYCWEVEEIKKS